MRFATIAILASTLASSALAASIYSRQPQFEDEFTTLTRRNGVMTCSSHNYNLMCATTHECLTTSGAPTHKAGTYAGNDFCTTECQCGRQPLGEISGNEQRLPQGQRARPAGARTAPRGRSASPAGRAGHRRSEFEDEFTTLTRRDGVMTCNSHNYNLMCATTHECLTTSGAPTHKAGTYAGNDFCTTECKCGRQPLGEISGNEQRLPQGQRARPAGARTAPRGRSASPAGRAGHRRSEFDDEYTTLTRRNGVMTCNSHNYNLMCATTHECLTTSGAPTHKAGTYAGNDFCTTECKCGRQPLGEISGNEQRLPQGQRSRPAGARTAPRGRSASPRRG